MFLKVVYLFAQSTSHLSVFRIQKPDNTRFSWEEQEGNMIIKTEPGNERKQQKVHLVILGVRV